MTHHDYLTYLQGLARVVLTPEMPKTMNRPIAYWWPLLLARAGVSEVVQGKDLGEALTWQELTMVHGYLAEVLHNQFENAIAAMPENDGRAVVASPIPEADRRKTPLTPDQQVAAAHVHAKLQQFEGEVTA